MTSQSTFPLDVGAPDHLGTRRKDVTTPNGDNFIGNDTSTATSMSSTFSSEQRERDKAYRENLVIWKMPLKTFEYFCKEIIFLLQTYGLRLTEYRKTVAAVVLSCVFLFVLLNQEDSKLFKTFAWSGYWVSLGILSSVGLGTGLHTFLLYLGPHIAKVTIAAYECGSLNFPEPPYPDEIVCPDEYDSSYAASIWNIMSKVRLEAMLWGAGTALGELPPYFMARAARLSGYDPDDEDDLREFEELQRKRAEHPENMTIIDKAKIAVERLVERVGFLGILACASIPNPLFDLAGITCGHFLVPFWTFFGATLIGKAIIKMHIQKMFVIIAFNDVLIENAVAFLAHVPVVGRTMQGPFKEFLNNQKQKMHKRPGSAAPVESGSLLAWIFEKFVIAMILYFLVSIVNSLAQSYHKRIHKRHRVAGKKHATD